MSVSLFKARIGDEAKEEPFTGFTESRAAFANSNGFFVVTTVSVFFCTAACDFLFFTSGSFVALEVEFFDEETLTVAERTGFLLLAFFLAEVDEDFSANEVKQHATPTLEEMREDDDEDVEKKIGARQVAKRNMFFGR